MNKKSFYIGTALATIFMVAISFCSSHFQANYFQANCFQTNYSKPHGNIDTLLKDIKNISGETGIGNLGSLYEDLHKDFETTRTIKYEDKAYTKEDLDALQKYYLSEAKEADKIEFLTELEQSYEVDNQTEFFKRQIRFSKSNLDLAIIGAGIFGVHQTYQGNNHYVKQNEQEKYIDFIRDQVQSSVASSDMNYKAIVFRGIYSSFSQ